MRYYDDMFSVLLQGYVMKMPAQQYLRVPNQQHCGGLSVERSVSVRISVSDVGRDPGLRMSLDRRNHIHHASLSN